MPARPAHARHNLPVRYGCQVERRKWLVLSAVSVGTFMATLDGGIVNISLPRIAESFGIDIATVEWVVVAYLLTIGSLILPIGRAGEILTFRRVYLAGFALFTAASVLCGLAPSEGALILSRVVQGVGAAMLMAMGPAIVARTFGPGERGRALGINAISVSIGLSLGPALGGLLTELGSWRAIFLVNLPVGIVAILWAARVLAVEPPGRRQSFDLPGSALSASAAFCLLLALSQGQSWGWTSPAVLGLLVLFVALGIAFIGWERRAVQPMIDLALFRIRAFSAGLASVVIMFAALFTATFLLPFMLQDAAGFSPLEAGLLLTPVPIMAACVAPFSGALSDRIGSRLPASLGMALTTLGILSLTQLPAQFTPPDLVWRLALIGIGHGLFMSPNTSAVLGSVLPSRLGTASGTLAHARIDGQALGIAASAAIIAFRLPVHLAAIEPSAQGAAGQAFVLAAEDAFAVAAVVCAIGIVTSLVRGPGLPGRGGSADAGEAARPARPAPTGDAGYPPPR
ncbi:MAG: drug resistance transporter, EmrB/QacA subfamily [Chloroflexi bacterium]|nr:drug resistance transporter, EmrB/QacA subfamily [Chloroflexota bacterium]